MTLSISKSKLCEVVQGAPLNPSNADQKIVFRGVEFDSRNIRGGELFVALPGEKTHGHSFVPDVLSRGAALALVEDGAPFASHPEADRIVVVSDSLAAFSALASWWRQELNTPLFAVTGSVGKTTVKEIAAHLLLGFGPGGYSLKSYNNHVGVPYSLCKLSPEHQWAIVEMGMNHAGEISHLSRLARPDHVAITTVAPAHIENLGSLSGIAKAKCEIIEGLRSGGQVILPDAGPELASELARIDPAHSLNVVHFGEGQGCAARISELRSLGLEGISFDLELSRAGKVERAAVRMTTLGSQNAFNAACAALAACALIPSLSLDFIAARLGTFVAPLMRMNLKQYSDDVSLIDDSYNANPASMGAFLDLAGDLQKSGLPVALVVGDMLELGSFSAHYHDQIGQRLLALRPAAVAAVGPEAKRYLASIGGLFPAFHAASAEEAAAWIMQQPAIVYMVKASRGIGLDKAVRKMEEILQGSSTSRLGAGSSAQRGSRSSGGNL